MTYNIKSFDTMINPCFGGRGLRGEVANVLDCNIVVGKWEPQSGYYDHF